MIHVQQVQISRCFVPALGLALLAIPLVEIALFVIIGGEIGLLWTLVAVVATAVIGTALLSSQGLAAQREARQSLARNELPVRQIFDGICLLIAALLLVTPGFATDAIGFALCIPPVRRFMGNRLRSAFVNGAGPGNASGFDHASMGYPPGSHADGANPRPGDATVIEGELIEPRTPDHSDTSHR